MLAEITVIIRDNPWLEEYFRPCFIYLYFGSVCNQRNQVQEIELKSLQPSVFLIVSYIYAHLSLLEIMTLRPERIEKVKIERN